MLVSLVQLNIVVSFSCKMLPVIRRKYLRRLVEFCDKPKEWERFVSLIRVFHTFDFSFIHSKLVCSRSYLFKFILSSICCGLLSYI